MSPRIGIPARLGALAAALAVALLAPSAAQARLITIGPSLTGAYTVGVTFLYPAGVTLMNKSLSDPEANVVSPVDGVIRRWRLTAQGAADPYALRVLRPSGATAFTGAGSSASRLASTSATQTFEANLPIQAGDSIGIDLIKANPSIKGSALSGAVDPFWGPPLENGVSLSPTNVISGLEFGFNADVEPAPRVVLISPSSGPIAGGTSVTIAGSDFGGVKEVKFGTVPATSFTVGSDAEITAVAPAAAEAAPVDVTVTTGAGTSPPRAGARFTYEAPAAATPAPVVAPVPKPTCQVPKLAGKKLKGARKALAAAHCKLGKVTRAGRKATKVAGQSPKPGTTRPAGSAVNVSLG